MNENLIVALQCNSAIVFLEVEESANVFRGNQGEGRCHAQKANKQ